jgi:energy-coupling factor transporter ATP-binding protein EcfA2
MNIKQPKILAIKTIEQAADEARQKVALERSGAQLGLFTRFNNINAAMLKYFRFGQVTMIAGASGSGKSAILNMIEDDFTNTAINGKFHKEVLLIACKYEMSAADELLRTTSGKIEKPYSYLLSSDFNKDTKAYNTITDNEFTLISETLEKLKGRSIYFIEVAGNLNQLFATVKYYRDENPEKEIVVTIDHSLLSAKLDEKDDLALMSATAHCAMRMKKVLRVMVIFINQLNGIIETAVRKENHNLHYPQKTDIHCGNQLFWACDDVWVFHRPEMIGIDLYGKRKIPTKNLIHGLLLKSRFGVMANCWFEQEFAKGRMTSRDIEYFIKKPEPFGIR